MVSRAITAVALAAISVIGTALARTGAPPTYTPTWASLDARPLPSWYDEAKLGIFLHWGVFSVPSWGTPNGGASGEWFWWQWKGANNPKYGAFVNATERPGWKYSDYAPEFTAELYDPAEWASLFKASGAKYVVLTSKHHEGWTNWPSKQAWNWNAVDNGPHRDILGDLATAVRAEGLTWGLYHSLFEWFNPLYLADKAANFTTNDYVTQVLQPQLHDIINSYQPHLIWSDGDWEADDTYWQSKEFLAWLYNDSPVKDSVVVNDRWGINDTCKHGGYYTCQDRYNPGHLVNHKWENAMTLDKYSWGYRRNMQLADTLSTHDVITELVSTVSCGGNLLINVGPRKDGTIALVFQERLTQLGEWMGINGEAIYSSKPWRAQNDTTAGNTWYTVGADGSVYASVLQWPQGGNLTLAHPKTSPSTKVAMLGLPGVDIAWSPQAGGGMVVTMPTVAPDQVSSVAWVLKLMNVS